MNKVDRAQASYNRRLQNQEKGLKRGRRKRVGITLTRSPQGVKDKLRVYDLPTMKVRG